MVFQDYALYPHMTARENMSFGLRQKVEPAKIRRQVETAAELLGWKSSSAARPSSRRPAAAGGGGSGRGPQPGRAAHGRAALQSGRQLAGADPDRDQAPPARPRHHLGLRHPRPGGGDGALRPDGGDPQRQAAAGRSADGGLPPSGQPVRRRLHRQPGHDRWRSSWPGRRPPAVPVGTAVIDLPRRWSSPLAGRMPARRSSASVPPTSPSGPRRTGRCCGARSSWSSRSARSPMSTSMSRAGRSRPWRIRIRHPHRATGSRSPVPPAGFTLRCGHGGAAVSEAVRPPPPCASWSTC